MEIFKELIKILKNNKYILNLLLLLGIIFTLISFLNDYLNTKNNGSMDLRNRIVGARIYKHTNLNPYTFRWKKGTDEKFVDPFDNLVGFEANRVTVTPFALWLHTLFCDLPYKKIQFLWNGFMWILLIISTLLLLKNSSSFRKKISIIAIFFIIYSSYFLRLHIDKGQIYILYLFLFSLSYYFIKSHTKYSNPLFGLSFGLLVALRPPAIIALLPFFVAKRFKPLFFVGIFSVFFLLIPVLKNGFLIYHQYFMAMNRHSLLHTGKLDLKYDEYPNKPIIDGVKNLKSDGNYPLRDSSVQWLAYKNLHIIFSKKILMILLFIILSLFILYQIKHYKSFDDDLLFLSAFSIFYISDFFLPAARLSYNNVFWLFPVIIFVKRIKLSPKTILPIILLILSFILNLLYYINDWSLVIADYLFWVFSITALISLVKKNDNSF